MAKVCFTKMNIPQHRRNKNIFSPQQYGIIIPVYKTPAKTTAGVTGKSVSDVITEHQQTEKNYGTIINESGKLEGFKGERLEIMNDNLNSKVSAGTLTQEKSDAIYNNMKENQTNCDGTVR